MSDKTKKKRLPWGHESRHCQRCGKVGPRVRLGFGYVHFYCLTPDEKRERRRRVTHHERKTR